MGVSIYQADSQTSKVKFVFNIYHFYDTAFKGEHCFFYSSMYQGQYSMAIAQTRNTKTPGGCCGNLKYNYNI